MLPKINRIDVKLFDKVFKEGKTYYSDSFRMKTLEIKNQKESRFAFVIPKKVVKKATNRNKLKRQGYAIIEKFIKTASPASVSIFILKKTLETKPQKLSEKEISDLLKRAEVIYPKLQN